MSKTNDNNSELKLGEVTITFPRVAAERMYEEIKKAVGNGTLTPNNIIIILINLMQIADKYVDLKGAQKKAVVLEAILQLIDSEIEDESEKEKFKQFVLLTLPSVVDSFVKLDTNKLKIKSKRGVLGIFRKCFPGKKPRESNFYTN